MREMIGQMMVFGFDGKKPDERIKKLITRYRIGGVILFTRNMGNTDEILALTVSLQKTAKEAGYEKPLLICVDQENGVVRRLGKGTTVFPGAMLLGAAGDPRNAYEIGFATGVELKALGINWNLAPVTDINNNPSNPVIGVRSYGEDPFMVSAFAKQAILGMRKAGIITTLKHFPGHGDTDTDSHLALPVIRHDLSRLRAVELVPYKELIPWGVDTIMTAHIHFPAIERRKIPATLSHNIVTGLLREELGYDGVITTDCMEMKAVRETIGTAQGTIDAINAGVDIVMISHTYELQEASAQAVYDSVRHGDIPEEKIMDAYNRISKLKDKYLSWEDILANGDTPKVSEKVGCQAHSLLAWKVFRKGIKLFRNESNIIPAQKNGDTLVIHPGTVNMTLAEDVEHSNCSLGMAIRSINPCASEMCIDPDPDASVIAEVLSRINSFDIIIVGTLCASQNPGQIKLVRKLLETGKNLIIIAMKSPYDYQFFPDVPAYIATFEYTYPALLQAARVLYGHDIADGEMHVTLP